MYKAINKQFEDDNRLRKGSVVSYPERGEFGDSSYRGNTTGIIIKDLLTFYKPKKFLECFAGSGTGHDVAQSLGIVNSVHLDLNPKFGQFNLLTDEFPTGFDFCFSHPPYWDIVKYSGSQWGKEKVVGDLSHVESYEEFLKLLNHINMKVYQSLQNGGRHAILIGDVKKKGKYYSAFKDIDFHGDLESHVIKVQHNTFSSSKNYSNYNFIPIAHEHLIILRKNKVWELPITVCKKVELNLKNSPYMTWRDLIQASLQETGGKATLGQIYEIVEGTEKARKNNHWKEKVRQTLQVHKNFEPVNRGIWRLAIA